MRSILPDVLGSAADWNAYSARAVELLCSVLRADVRSVDATRSHTD
jgi:hypothetical protein